MTKISQLFDGIFNDQDFYGKMLKITVPVLIQNFISSFLNLIDTVMVGKLGETEIAAVGIANQYFFFFNMFLIGLSAGCAVFISQFWGKKDIANIRRILGIGLASSLLFSLMFMAAGYFNPAGIISLFNNDGRVISLGGDYLRLVLISYAFTGITFVYNFSLRSVGKASEPMVISAIALVCNAFLNYVFIFGKLGSPEMGVLGAALATVIARVIEAGLLIIYVYAGKGVLAASLRDLTDVTYDFVKRSYRTIFPVILNDICWGLGTVVYLAVYGRMGTQAVAAIQICNTVNNLFLVGIFGMSNAAAVMVGNSIGAGEEDLGRDYARRFSVLSVVVGIGLGLTLAAFSPLILRLFNVSPEVRSSSLTILYIISAIFFIRVFDVMLIVGILRGGGDAKQAFLIEGFTMWFIGVPLTILGAFVFHFPVYLVYGLSIFEEIFKGIMGLIRLGSGHWIKNVTHNMI